MKAKHPRFEVEDILRQKNYTFVFDARLQTVALHDTSRGSGNEVMEVWGPEKFPGNYPTAVEYYDFLYEKSLTAAEGICFLGYVDENFEPLEEKS